MHLDLDPEKMKSVRWSKGSCGRSGCSDPECVCASCAKPIGIDEEDAHRSGHDEDCLGCEICQDDVPIILFRGHGKFSVQAAFYHKCFEKLLVQKFTAERG